MTARACPLLDHGPDDFKHLPNLRATVDEVAEEDHLAFGMAVRHPGLLVAEGFEQLHQFIGMAVNVADQVVHGLLLFRLPLDFGDFSQEVAQFVTVQFADRGNAVNVSDQVFLYFA